MINSANSPVNKRGVFKIDLQKTKGLRGLFFLILFAAVFFIGPMQAKAADMVEITAKSINIRSGPSTAYKIIGSAVKGDTFPLIKEESGWYNIKFTANTTGWVINTYSKINLESSKLPLYVQINSGIVNIRLGPGTNYEKIAEMQPGLPLSVTGESGDWYEIITEDGKTGYVASWLVQATINSGGIQSPPVSSGGLPEGYKQGTVNEDTLNIRKTPGVSGELLGTLNKGAKVAIYESRDGWFKVLAETGQSGWVSGLYITLFDVFTSSAVTKENPLPQWDGKSVSRGNISLKWENTPYGCRLIFTGSSRLVYNISRRGEGLIFSGDMAISLDTQTGSCLALNYEGSTKSSLNIKGDKYLYYHEDLSADGKVLRLETGYSPVVGKLIYLDPGHGNYNASNNLDCGAAGAGGLKEKDVNIDIARKAEAILLSQGADVRLTRGDTTFLTLEERAWMANAAQADIFISIHCNSATNRQAQGTSTWFYAPNGGAFDRSIRLEFARIMQEAMVKHSGRPNYGVREDRFVVLRETTMPSVLLETAFISNQEEEGLLATDSFRQALAEGIAAGAGNYFASCAK